MALWLYFLIKKIRIGDGRDDDYTRDFLQTTSAKWEIINKKREFLSLKGKRI